MVQANIKGTELILSALAPVLQVIAQTKFVEVLQKLNEKDEKKYKSVITSLYQAFDVSIEPLTDDSKTNIDNAIVDAIKGAIEQSAGANNVTLKNLDND